MDYGWSESHCNNFKFLNDEIKYKGVSFSELPDNEQRRIKNMKTSYTETRDWSREQCQDFLYAYSGRCEAKGW